MIEFIVNPSSRGGQGVRVWRQVLEELKRQGKREDVDFHVHFTKASLRANQIAAEIAAQPDAACCVLAVLGGDGTLNEVLNGLPEDGEMILAYLPTGSGNDFARSVKLSAEPGKAVDTILHPGYYRALDFGVAETGNGIRRRFLVSGGIGYDAAVCHKLLYSRVRKVLQRVHLEKLGYLLVGIAQIACADALNGRLTVDGGREWIELRDARFISAHIHPYEGGGFCFAPSADPEDGKLELCVVNRCSKLRFVAVLVASLFRRHGRMEGVRLIRCERAQIQLAETVPVHTDGESAGCQSAVTFLSGRRKVRFLVGGNDRRFV